MSDSMSVHSPVEHNEERPPFPCVAKDGGIYYPSDACCVCFDGDVTDGNEIVYCDSCELSVHQVCYGVKEVGYILLLRV